MQAAFWLESTTTRTKMAPSLQAASLVTAGLQLTETGEEHVEISLSKFLLFDRFQSVNNIFGSGIVVLDIYMQFTDRYWKESHFQAIDLVVKTLDAVYGSQKPTLTSAAMRWMYHHSKLQVSAVKKNYIENFNSYIRPTLTMNKKHCYFFVFCSIFLKSEHFYRGLKSDQHQPWYKVAFSVKPAVHYWFILGLTLLLGKACPCQRQFLIDWPKILILDSTSVLASYCAWWSDP